MQTKIPCVIVRDCTSRAPFFHLSDLPADTATRDAMLLSVMGSPHEIQFDGIGGSHSVTANELDADFIDGKQELRRAALIRTARRIFEGKVHVPKAVWAGK